MLNQRRSAVCRRALAASLLAGTLAAPSSHAGAWTRLTRNAPGPVVLMILLPDGSVMAANNGGNIGSAWYRLRPDSHGSYVNGTWSAMAAMHDTRLWYSSAVLQDGRVFVAGGEYGTGAARAEVYDPVADSWTQLPIPTSVLNPAASSAIGGTQKFYDADAITVANGSVLISPVFPPAFGATILYNPLTNLWSRGPTLANGQVYMDEATWVKLPDQSILTIDPFTTTSQRYIPATNTWIPDSNVPVSIYDPFGGEMGGGFLLPDGRAWMIGALPHTAYYTPSGTTAPGTWTAGPDIPGNHGVPDGPAAMLVTGKVLLAVSPTPTSADHFPSPVTFYEFDPATNTYTPQQAPNGASDPTPAYTCLMLALPDGNVLYSHFGTDVYVYSPVGAPIAAGKPVIQSITQTGDRTFHLTGTGLNGISQGASYGDDAQMDSNYPLVRFTDGAGNVYYGRTFDWSSTAVRTGAQVLTTEFKLPPALPAGQYNPVVVANGIASDPSPQPITAPPPAAPGAFSLLTPAPGANNVPTSTILDWSDATLASDYIVTLSASPDLSNPIFTASVTQSQVTLSPGTLAQATNYYWSVTARTADQVPGNSTPTTATFTTFVPPPPCTADFNADGFVNTTDLLLLLGVFGQTVPPFSLGDINGDGHVTTVDLLRLLGEFGRACP